MARPLPPASASPFTCEPNGPSRATALCIHGYTGTPFEVLPVALALKDVDVTSVGIVLPGHEGGKDGSAAALNQTSWEDWVFAGERAFAALPTDKPRILVGSSMGALVSLLIASRRPRDVAALVLLAPALRFFRDGKLAAFAAARGLWRVLPQLTKERKGGDVADPIARDANPSLPVLPLRGIAELGALQRIVEPELPRVIAPLCLIHGKYDHTIPPEASKVIAAKVGSRHVEHHVMPRSWHIVGIDLDRDEVCAVAQSFIADVLMEGRLMEGSLMGGRPS